MVVKLLTYNELFGEKVKLENVISIIRLMNANHIAHLMILIMNRNIRREEFKLHYLKNKTGFISEKISKSQIEINMSLVNKCLHPNNEIFSVQGMLLLLKYIYIYSEDLSPRNADGMVNFDEDIFVEVIDAQLMLSDYIQVEIEDNALLEYNLKKFHLGVNLKGLISRTWYIYSQLAIDREKVQVDDKQFLDFNLAYLNEMKYSIEEFLAVYFFMFNQFDNEIMLSPFVNYKKHFKNAKNASICEKIIQDNMWTVQEFKEKALSTLDNTWDFEMFTTKPFLACNLEYCIIPSDIHLKALLFNNFRDVVQRIYGEKGNGFKQYLGYPFEVYIQELCFSACEKSEFTPKKEFVIKGNDKSSEFYMWTRNKMIIIEAKSMDIDRKKLFSNTDSNIIKGIVHNQFVKPIHQIDKTCISILATQHKELFVGIDEIIAISVTFENTHLSVADYYDHATTLLSTGEFEIKTPWIKTFFNFSIEEFECLIWLIENKYDVFAILKRYFEKTREMPFYNFLTNESINYRVIPEYLDDIYTTAINKLFSRLAVDGETNKIL